MKRLQLLVLLCGIVNFVWAAGPPVLNIPFDEDNRSSSSQADDISGSGNNLWVIYNNDQVYNRHAYPDAMQMTEASYCIILGSNTNIGMLRPTGDFSVSMWVWLQDNSEAQTFLGSVQSPTGERGYNFGINSSGQLTFVVGDGSAYGTGGNRTATGGVLSDSAWHHVVAVVRTSPSIDIELYVDGSFETASITGSATTIDHGTGDFYLGFGNAIQEGPISNFNGAIDDIQIFDEAILGVDVLGLHDEGANDHIIDNGEFQRLAYEFDGDASDGSSYGNHATVHGATLARDRFGEENTSMYFDGTDDYLRVPADPSIQVQYPLSVSVWVWLENSTASTHKIFTNNDDASDYQGVSLQGSSTGKLGFHAGDGGFASSATRRSIVLDDNIPSQVWTHIVAVMNTPTDMQMYVNGALASATLSGSGGPDIHYDASFPGAVGGYDWGLAGANSYFQGALDELVFWSRGLTADEVADMYNPGMVNEVFWPTPQLVLDLGLNNDAYDSSAYANHGTVSGTQGADDRFGNPNGAIYFDGVNDKIELPEDASYQRDFPLTVSSWFWLDDATVANRIFSTSTDNSTYSGVNLVTEGGKIRVLYGDGSGSGSWDRSFYTGATDLSSQHWHHVVVVLNSITEVDIYLDGNLETLTQDFGPWDIGHPSGSGGGLASFQLSPTDPVYYMKGAIDELRIWDNIMSPSAAMALFNPGSTNDLNLSALPVVAVLAYDFDTDTEDLTINANHAIANEGQFVNDRFGMPMNAFYFDGVNDYLSIPADPTFQVVYPFTVSLWVWLDDPMALTNKIFTNSDHDGYSGFMIQTNSGKLSLHCGDALGGASNNRRSIVGSTVASAKQWHHLVAIARSPTDMTLYLDGVDDGGTLSGTSNSTVSYAPSGNGMIGAFDWSTGFDTRYFKGAVDDIILYNGALTPTEVAALYLPGSSNDLGTITDIDGEVVSDLSVFPNPTNDRLLIRSNKPIKSIQVYNTFGALQSVRSEGNALMVQELQSGVYHLEIEDEQGQVKTARFTKF